MTQRERLVPKIGPRTRVSPDNAMIDRFELRVDGWQAEGTRPELATRFGNLSAWQVETASGDLSNIFQDAELSADRSRYYLIFRKSGRGPNRNVVHPLISGQVVVQILSAATSSLETVSRCVFHIDGSWNLTRFLQAHEFPRKTKLHRPQAASVFPFVIEPKPDWWRWEMPLVADDNIIIGKGSRFAFALSQPVEEHLRTYVGGTLGLFVQQLIACDVLPAELPEDTPDNIYDPREYALGDIEFYWEFDHEAPIAFVDTLTHYLPRVAKRMRVTRKHLDQIGAEVSEQSQSATIYLTRKRQVKVYAKTNRRVRFEVTFPDGYRSKNHRRSTFGTLEELVTAVSRLKIEAADTLNDVLANLWNWVDPHNLDATPDQLRAAIVAAAEDPFVATAIIYNLAKHGRIALKKGDPLRPTVRRLAKLSRPVLRTLSTDRDIYVVERRFEYARRNLRLV